MYSGSVESFYTAGFYRTFFYETGCDFRLGTETLSGNFLCFILLVERIYVIQLDECEVNSGECYVLTCVSLVIICRSKFPSFFCKNISL
jgi:hypothetical protein